MINLVTIEDIEELEARLRVVEGNLVQLQKDFKELVEELKEKIKK